MAGKRDEAIRKFADTVARGAIVYCSPEIFGAIKSNGEYVGKFAGCELRSSAWCAPGMIYAVMPREVRTPLSVRQSKGGTE